MVKLWVMIGRCDGWMGLMHSLCFGPYLHGRTASMHVALGSALQGDGLASLKQRAGLGKSLSVSLLRRDDLKPNLWVPPEPDQGRSEMHAVVRRYTGVSSLIEQMSQRQGEVEEIIKNVPGFKAYYAVRDGDALTTITVCEDSTGTETSTGRAAEWVRDNLPDLTASPPEVSDGDVFLQFTTH